MKHMAAGNRIQFSDQILSSLSMFYAHMSRHVRIFPVMSVFVRIWYDMTAYARLYDHIGSHMPT